MKFLFFGILSIVAANCNRKICTNRIDVYKDLYKRYLIILEDSKHPRKFVTPKETNEAIMYLEVISGITSRADRQHDLSYRNKSDFNGDFKLWKQWYKQNQCNITLHYVDSAFNSVGIKR